MNLPYLGMMLGADREGHYNLTNFSWISIYMTYVPRFNIPQMALATGNFVTILKYSDYSSVLVSTDLVLCFVC
jgi:hypothetical protein